MEWTRRSGGLLVAVVTCGTVALFAGPAAASWGGTATTTTTAATGTTAATTTKASTTTTAKASPASATGPASVGVATTTSLGKVLVDGAGMTLYTFKKDTGSVATCTGKCAALWPPLLTKGTPKAGGGVGGNLGVTTGSGPQQATYNGHPLYTYSGDTKPGQTNGQGLFHLWYAAVPLKAGATAAAATPTTTAASGTSKTGGSSAAGGSGSLPKTGASPLWDGGVGMGLLLAGGALWWRPWRRRQA